LPRSIPLTNLPPSWFVGAAAAAVVAARHLQAKLPVQAACLLCFAFLCRGAAVGAWEHGFVEEKEGEKARAQEPSRARPAAGDRGEQGG